jgi:hypothetical protein
VADRGDLPFQERNDPMRGLELLRLGYPVILI